MKSSTNVLIVGAPRSGTTLLSGLLSSGSQATPMLPECTYLTQIIEHFHNIINYSDPHRFSAYAINESVLAEKYCTMVNLYLETARSHFDPNFQYLILKDPELTKFIDLIPRFFGEKSKIVCIVRDPRDVISSMSEVEKNKRKRLKTAWSKAPNWVTTKNLIDQWFHERMLLDNFFVYYWRVIDSQLYKCRKVHIVKYENITAQDEDEFSKLEDFLEFSVGRKGFEKMHFEFDRTDPTHSAHYGNTVQPVNRDFSKNLSTLQIKKIMRVFSGMNSIYGWWE